MPHADSGVSGGPAVAEFFAGDLERHPGRGDAPPRAAIQASGRHEGVLLQGQQSWLVIAKLH